MTAYEIESASLTGGQCPVWTPVKHFRHSAVRPMRYGCRAKATAAMRDTAKLYQPDLLLRLVRVGRKGRAVVAAITAVMARGGEAIVTDETTLRTMRCL